MINLDSIEARTGEIREQYPYPTHALFSHAFELLMSACQDIDALIAEDKQLRADNARLIALLGEQKEELDYERSKRRKSVGAWDE